MAAAALPAVAQLGRLVGIVRNAALVAELRRSSAFTHLAIAVAGILILLELMVAAPVAIVSRVLGRLAP